jgi:anti-anti-sigma factor
LRAHQHAAPLIVARSQAESGRVGLKLIGELDLNTVVLLQAELAASREQAPPAVIDLSELRFLDLVGLRALLRIGQVEGVAATRLVGATGIVRRLIELTRALDAESDGAEPAPFPGAVTAKVVIEELAARGHEVDGAIAGGDGSRSDGSALNGTSPPARAVDRRAR